MRINLKKESKFMRTIEEYEMMDDDIFMKDIGHLYTSDETKVEKYIIDRFNSIMDKRWNRV